MEVFNADAINAIQDIPGLYISDITIPQSSEKLKEHGITHVLTLTNKRDCPKIDKETGISQLHIDIEDNPLEDLLLVLGDVCDWIDNALSPRRPKPSSETTEVSDTKETHTEETSTSSASTSTQEPKVLVHCLQGISRSGAIVTAYLMRARHLSFDVALSRVRGYRAIIMPNSGFSDQSRLWEMMGYSIFMERKWAEGGKGGEEDKETMDGDERKEAKERKKKLQYEKWRDDRGVLLSKSEQEKQKVLVASMANMAASFGKRRLELKKRV